MTMVSEASEAKPRAGLPALAGWVLFDVATQPFYTLLTTFVFSPFFAAHVADNPTVGQTIWGYTAGIAGLFIALMAPVLGAIADAAGRRKPWIAFFGGVLMLGSLALWFVVPGTPGAVVIAVVAFAVATIGSEFATVFNNAMMPSLVEEEKLGRLSGVGWGAGYAGGLFSLVIALGFLVASPETGRTLLGVEPWFGLDPATYEGDRASGPLTAIWFLVFVLPLFLFTPDEPKRMGLRPAARQGLAELWDTVRHVGGHANVLRFLVAHMIYADGLIALFTFAGIYAAGTFGWTTIELGMFGIILTVVGIAGGVIGGWLDDRLGAKPVIIGSLILLILASAGILSVDRNHVLFFIEVTPPVAGDGLFTSAGEKVYLALGIAIGLIVAPLQSASRSLIVRISPRDRLTQFFGLYALAGKLTSFAGPFAVATVTFLADSQRIGISVLILFFLVGGGLVLRVQPRRVVG